MPLTFNGFPLLTTTEVRGEEAMSKWPPFGRAYQSLICLSVVFALLSSFTLSLFSVSSLFMAIAALIMQCAMWLGNGNWLNDAAIVTICHSPFNVGCTPQCHTATLPHCHMPRTACLPAADGASIKDSIKFNWKCPREAADCNFNWQLQQLHRRTDREGRRGEKGKGRGIHCSSKITSLIWLQIACCCSVCVSLFVLAADSKSKNQLKIMCSSNRDREGRERRRWPDYLILISSQIRKALHLSTTTAVPWQSFCFMPNSNGQTVSEGKSFFGKLIKAQFSIAIAQELITVHQHNTPPHNKLEIFLAIFPLQLGQRKSS